MTLKFKIKGIKWKWIANFEELHWECDQSKSGLNSEALLMRNGTGKTTTLYILRHLFTGQKLPEALLRRAEYKGLLDAGYINQIEGNPEISVDIVIDSKTWTLGYKFKKDFSDATIFTQAPTQYHDEYSMPASFEVAFKDNDSMAELLFIDTQTVGASSRNLSKKLVDDVMATLSNIKVLDIAKEYEIPRILEKERNKSNKKGSAEEKRLAEQALKRCESTIRDIKDKLQSAKAELVDKKLALEDNQKMMIDVKQKSKIRQQFNELEKKLKDAESRVETSTQFLYDALLDPSNLPKGIWDKVKQYYAKLSNSRIPKSIAKEYLSSVLNEKICICGETLVGHQKRVDCINEKMNSSMGLAVLSEVYIMKDRVNVSSATTDISLLKSNLSNHRQQMAKIKTEAGRLSTQLGGKAKLELDKLGSEEEKLRSRIEALKEEIEMYESTNDGSIKTNRKEWCGRSMTLKQTPSEVPQDIGECKNLYWLRQIKKNLTKKLETIAGIEDLSNAADAIANLFNAVQKNVLSELQKETLEKSSEQLDDFEMQNGLRLHSLDDGITCITNSGRKQKGFSTGEELAVIFSFITALSEATQMSVPLIVDNPTKGLDPLKLVATEKALLGLKSQLILFIYSTEKNSLPTYYNQKHINPSTFKREMEDFNGRSKGHPGNYQIAYSWEMFNQYQPPITEGQ